MRRKKWQYVLLLLGLTLLLGFPSAAMAANNFVINVSDPDNPNGDQSYVGSTVNTALSVPQVSFGEERILGTLRITGKTGAEVKISEGNKLKISLPLGSCYMRTPTPENYRHYVNWPVELNGTKNQVCDSDGKPGMRFVEGTPHSITMEVNHLDQSAGTLAIDILFNQERFSTVRLSRLLGTAGAYKEDPNGQVTRKEFFLLLDDITRSIPSCPLKWMDSDQTLTQRFSDLEDVSASELDKIKPLVDSGVITGYSGGELRPSAYITRAEAANLVGRLFPLREELMGFNDEVPVWGSGLKNAVSRGLILGYPDGSFKPDQSITREETLILLQKTLESYPEQP